MLDTELPSTPLEATTAAAKATAETLTTAAKWGLGLLGAIAVSLGVLAIDKGRR